VGGGWTETDIGSNNQVRLDGSAMVFTSADGAFVPRATRTFTPQNSGVVAWSFVFNWRQTAPENNYDLLMQLGDSTTLADPAVNPTAGVATDLRWAGSAVPGSTGQESFGYVSNGTRTEIERGNGEITIRVVADLDTVRIMTNGLNTINFTNESFDTMTIDRVGGAVDDSIPPPLPVPVVVPEPGAGQVVIDNGPPGFSAVIQSAGGISAYGDVTVTPNRGVMGGAVAERLASPAFAIDLPADAPPITSARLTLPYQAQLLGGYPEADLRVHRLDEQSGLWVPVTAGQAIDTTADTISVDVTGFSTYAVLKVRDAAAWEDFFAGVPVQCVGTSVPVDAAMVIDTSGSMASNDPQAQRVPAAKQFVATMRDTDRAGVITFDSSAVVRRSLTPLDSPANRALVDTAINAGAGAVGGTNLSAAVSTATTMLSGTPGQQRVRAAILLTDGVSAYNTSLTAAAAAAGVTIYTIGLGAGVDANLLTAIAQGTGGEYIPLTDPNQLVAVYDRLVGDLIDDGTDTDSDGLTDCVERNGAFVPGLLSAGPFGATPALDGFVATNPQAADTDADGLPDLERDADGDGSVEVVELGELRGPFRLSSNSDPVLRDTYQFLIDAGLDTYYAIRADPRDADTDNDGLTDFDEVRINGTDPRIAESGGFGVPGLALPVNTLMQPVELTTDAVPGPFIRDYLIERGGDVAPRRAAPLVVSYDANDDCVPAKSGNGYCDAILAVAQAQPNDGRFVCWFGESCATDATQARDIIRQITAQQGIYTPDRRIRPSFAADQSLFICVAWTGQASACSAQSLTIGNPRPNDLAAAIAGVATRAAPSANGGIRVDPSRANALANSVINSVAVLAGVLVGSADRSDAGTAITTCYASPVLRQYRRISIYVHPCDDTAIFMPAADMPQAAQHDLDAITAGAPPVLTYATDAENRTRGFRDDWYRSTPECAGSSVEEQCDEYPYGSSWEGGPPTAVPPGQNTSVRLIDGAQNGAEGNALQQFYRVCDLKVGSAPRINRPFIVAPNLVAPRTIGICGRR